MKHVLLLAVLLLSLGLQAGCAVYSTATDERLMGTMSSDKAISTLIKKNLMEERFAEGWEISVYCYYGHVFLVGECPDKLRPKAIEIAKRDRRVRSVTPHWFSRKKPVDSDIALATKLRTTLIGTSNLNSTRIDTEVNSNRVVLLGVANNSDERKTAVEAARSVNGVATVTSYIMLPMKPDTNYHPTGRTYKGKNPPPAAPAEKKDAGQKDAKKAAPKDAPQESQPVSSDDAPEARPADALPEGDFDYGGIDQI